MKACIEGVMMMRNFNREDISSLQNITDETIKKLGQQKTIEIILSSPSLSLLSKRNLRTLQKN